MRCLFFAPETQKESKRLRLKNLPCPALTQVTQAECAKEGGRVCLDLPEMPQSTDTQKFSPETRAMGWKLGDLVTKV